MKTRYTIVVFRDGYQSPTPINSNRFSKNVFVIEANMFRRPVGYFVNIKLKRNSL